MSLHERQEAMENINKKHLHLLDKTKSIFIATFAHFENAQRMRNNGMVEPMLSFFVPRVQSVHMVIQPHPGSDRVNPEVELYENSNLRKKFTLHPIFYLPVYLLCILPSKRKIRLSYKIRDILSVLLVAFGQRKQYDFFIGLEAVNVLAGMVLKKLGIVKKTIYYVSDYSPTRFQNKWFNYFYVWLDRFALLNSDYAWDVSPAMIKGRIEAGLAPSEAYRAIHVPNGLFPSQIQSLPVGKRNKYDLVYMGILESDMGPDLAIRSLREVRRKFPKARLHMIGGPKKDLEDMKRLAARLGISNAVIFYGFVSDDAKMAEIVRNCYIGLAPYRAFRHSKRWYGDAGKIRQYTASGLPVVTTNVPPLGKYIVEKGAGIMTKDTVESFSDGIIKLLSDDELYKKLSAAAENISKDNTWENVYTTALRDMEKMNKI